MKEWRTELATLALFACIGPFLGMAILGMIGSGVSGLLTPLLFIIFVAFAGEAGLVAFAVLLVIPALFGGAAYLAARRYGHWALLIPATVLGGWLGLLLLHRILGGFPAPDLKWLVVATLTATTLVLIDIAARRWGYLVEPAT